MLNAPKLKEINLEFCKRSDVRYKTIRDRHYVENKGAHGQQIHFIIHYNDQIAGIISGGSSVYQVASRDEFFSIPSNKQTKEKFFLPAIVNNTVFRLEVHEKNLATRVLSKFRKVTQELWHGLYGVRVIGFETFVIETETRKGTLYKADNWKYLGSTVGRTKQHKSQDGMKGKSSWTDTDPKLVFAIKTKIKNPTIPYVSSWRRSTKEEKDRGKQIASYRKSLISKVF